MRNGTSGYPEKVTFTNKDFSSLDKEPSGPCVRAELRYTPMTCARERNVLLVLLREVRGHLWSGASTGIEYRRAGHRECSALRLSTEGRGWAV